MVAVSLRLVTLANTSHTTKDKGSPRYNLCRAILEDLVEKTWRRLGEDLTI
jgi:hypothetical protein